MNEKQILTNINLPRVFMNALVGFASGLLGTMVLGLILLVTWSIVGEVLVPTMNQTTNEFGEIITHKEKIHPLFMSVVIWGVFMAALAANILQTILLTNMDERYTARATSLAQVSIGNVVLLLVMIPAYISIGHKYGAPGIAFVALIHSALTAMFSLITIDILALKRYTLVSLYGVFIGLVGFLMIFNLFNPENPTVMAFVAMPLLLGTLSLGSGLTQLLYFWFADTYNNDFLDLEKRYGVDYGRAELVEETDDFSQEFGEF